MNKEEWLNKYGDEEYCIKLLEKIKWPNGVVCPNCNGNQLYYQKTRRVFQCKSCKHQTSATSGTIFHSTKLPLSKWFSAICIFASEPSGISSLKLSQALEVNWRSARLISNKIRTVMGSNEKKRVLSGMIECEDLIIEKQEKKITGVHNKIYIPGVDNNKENPEKSEAIFVALENIGNRPGAVAIHKTDLCTDYAGGITNFMKTRVDITESIIANYSLFKELEVNLLNPNIPWRPTIHIIKDQINRMIKKIYRGVSPKYLQEYIDELCYRFNNSRAGANMRQNLFEACLTHVRLCSNN